MTTHVMQMPANPPLRTTARGIALYLWMRFRRMFLVIAGLWLASALMDQAFLGGRITTFGEAIQPSHLVTMLMIPGLLMFAPMMAISEIDETLWTLPVRTESLVGWLMFYGSSAVGLFWILNAVFVWRPAGLDAPIWWPAAMLAAVQAAALAIRCQPFTFGTLHALIYSICTVLMVLTGSIAASEGAQPAAIVVVFLAITPLAYILGTVGAKWTRCGDTIGGAGISDIEDNRPLRTKFRSEQHAQAWFEWRNHGFYIMAAVLGLGALTLPVIAIPLVSEVMVITLLTRGAHHVSANSWAGGVPPFLVGSVLYFSLVIGCASPGMRESDKTLSPFLATRPLDCAGLVAAKLRAAALSSAAAWLAVVPPFFIWLALPAWENFHQINLGAALWRAVAPVLNGHTVAMIAVGLLALFYFSWKLQVETLFLQLTGRSWVPWVYTGIVLLPLAIPPFYNHVLTSPAVQPFLPGALFVAVILKLTAGGAIVRILRRRGLISARNLRSAIAMWAAGAITFFLLLYAAFAPEHIDLRITALAVILLMPGVRLSLAPMALAWDRSR